MTEAQPEPERCPRCGAPYPTDATHSPCPACALEAAATPQTAPSGRFAPPRLDELAGAFPQLELIELLGAGGMSAVFKARQLRLDRLVALKVLPRELSAEPGFAERFAREAKALARLNHPHLVTVHDFGQSGEWCWILMEYVDGANLRQVMTTGALEPKQALAIVTQICEALQYAHDEGVVHRDIKPENILIDRRGQVKIADFGIAKLAGGGHATLTGSNEVVGTAHYMAPEQVERSREVDSRADLYSLGVVFYEMLTGGLPLGRFAPPSQTIAVDVRLDEVVLKALAKEPERRYQRADEVKTDVDRIAAGPSDVPVADQRAAQPEDAGLDGALLVGAGLLSFLTALLVVDKARPGSFAAMWSLLVLALVCLWSARHAFARRDGRGDERWVTAGRVAAGVAAINAIDSHVGEAMGGILAVVALALWRRSFLAGWSRFKRYEADIWRNARARRDTRQVPAKEPEDVEDRSPASRLAMALLGVAMAVGAVLLWGRIGENPLALMVAMMLFVIGSTLAYGLLDWTGGRRPRATPPAAALAAGDGAIAALFRMLGKIAVGILRLLATLVVLAAVLAGLHAANLIDLRRVVPERLRAPLSRLWNDPKRLPESSPATARELVRRMGSSLGPIASTMVAWEGAYGPMPEWRGLREAIDELERLSAETHDADTLPDARRAAALLADVRIDIAKLRNLSRDPRRDFTLASGAIVELEFSPGFDDAVTSIESVADGLAKHPERIGVISDRALSDVILRVSGWSSVDPAVGIQAYWFTASQAHQVIAAMPEDQTLGRRLVELLRPRITDPERFAENASAQAGSPPDFGAASSLSGTDSTSGGPATAELVTRMRNGVAAVRGLVEAAHQVAGDHSAGNEASPFNQHWMQMRKAVTDIDALAAKSRGSSDPAPPARHAAELLATIGADAAFISGAGSADGDSEWTRACSDIQAAAAALASHPERIGVMDDATFDRLLRDVHRSSHQYAVLAPVAQSHLFDSRQAEALLGEFTDSGIQRQQAKELLRPRLTDPERFFTANLDPGEDRSRIDGDGR